MLFNINDFSHHHCNMRSLDIIGDTANYLKSVDSFQDEDLYEIARRMKRTDDNMKWYASFLGVFHKKNEFCRVLDIFISVENDITEKIFPRDHIIKGLNTVKEYVDKIHAI